MNHLKFHKNFTFSQQGKACDLLAAATGLSKTAIKRVMNSGAVWHQRGKMKQRRLRRASSQIRAGERLEIFYDDDILSRPVPSAVCLKDFEHYSIWYKPAGLMTQGNRYGDRCALTRQVERYFSPRRSAYIVHRIDRETAGLVILCHSKQAAGRFSGMFQRREIKKGYDVRVLGDLRDVGGRGEIDLPIDGRHANTFYRWVAYDQRTNESRADVEIITGRTHQIRRHFEMIGHPVMGDPRYGVGNKNRSGLKLVATSLVYNCPYRQRSVNVQIDPDHPPTIATEVP